MKKNYIIECIIDNVVRGQKEVPNTNVVELINGAGKEHIITGPRSWVNYTEYPTEKEYYYNGYIIGKEKSTILNPRNTQIGSVAIGSTKISGEKFAEIIKQADETTLKRILSDNKIDDELLIEYVNLKKAAKEEITPEMSETYDSLERLDAELDSYNEMKKYNCNRKALLNKEKTKLEEDIKSMKSMKRSQLLVLIDRSDLVDFLAERGLIELLTFENKYTIDGVALETRKVDDVTEYVYPVIHDTYYNDMHYEHAEEVYTSRGIELENGFKFETIMNYHDVRMLLGRLNDYDLEFVLDDLYVSKDVLMDYFKGKLQERIQEIVYEINNECTPNGRFYKHRITELEQEKKELEAKLNTLKGSSKRISLQK